jgi:hypothetical protein
MTVLEANDTLVLGDLPPLDAPIDCVEVYSDDPERGGVLAATCLPSESGGWTGVVGPRGKVGYARALVAGRWVPLELSIFAPDPPEPSPEEPPPMKIPITLEWKVTERRQRGRFDDGGLDLESLQYYDEASSTWRRSYEIPTPSEMSAILAALRAICDAHL